MHKQIVELQSLRGIAAFVVAASHLSMVYTLPRAARLSLDCVLNAHAAVILFFVLSGFVLTASLVRNELSFPSIVAFYVRRVFRLYPALWVISGVSVVLLLAGSALKSPDGTSG
jgi:peptidoglycan/LPS O-acetylase OafA/YrhL